MRPAPTRAAMRPAPTPAHSLRRARAVLGAFHGSRPHSSRYNMPSPVVSLLAGGRLFGRARRREELLAAAALGIPSYHGTPHPRRWCRVGSTASPRKGSAGGGTHRVSAPMGLGGTLNGRDPQWCPPALAAWARCRRAAGGAALSAVGMLTCGPRFRSFALVACSSQHVSVPCNTHATGVFLPPRRACSGPQLDRPAAAPIHWRLHQTGESIAPFQNIHWTTQSNPRLCTAPAARSAAVERHRSRPSGAARNQAIRSRMMAP